MRILSFQKHSLAPNCARSNYRNRYVRKLFLLARIVNGAVDVVEERSCRAEIVRQAFWKIWCQNFFCGRSKGQTIGFETQVFAPRRVSRKTFGIALQCPIAQELETPIGHFAHEFVEIALTVHNVFAEYAQRLRFDAVMTRSNDVLRFPMETTKIGCVVSST